MSRLLSVSIPDDLAAGTEALARLTGKTKSEVMRDALRRHLQRERFLMLQDDGRRHAEARGVGPEEVEDAVDELRAARR